MLSYSNLVSAFVLHFEEMCEVLTEMADRAGATNSSTRGTSRIPSKIVTLGVKMQIL